MDNKVLAFRLENFMGFEDTGWLDLKPITLLFGRNSTGKSALIRALLLLRQSVDSEGKVNPLIFVDDNGTDVGTFRDFVRNHDETKQISFYFKVLLDASWVWNTIFKKEANDFKEFEAPIEYQWIAELKLSFGIVNSILSLTELTIQSESEALEDKAIEFMTGKIPVFDAKLENSSWKYTYDFLRNDDYLQNKADPENQVDNQTKYKERQNNVSEDNKAEDRREFMQEEDWKITQPVFKSGFIPRFKIKHQVGADNQHGRDLYILNNFFLTYLDENISSFLHSVIYIGPIRSEPQRFYYVPQKIHKDVGKQGEHIAQAYLAAKNQDRKQIDEIAEWVRKIAPGNQFDVIPVAQYLSEMQTTQQEEALMKQLQLPEIPLHVVLLKSENLFKANLRDVGFGISQVLPVIIQSLLAEPGSTVIIEQPELHLHPEAQVTLADFLINCASNNELNFLIETHSEHILLRFQRRIAETSYDKLCSSNSKLRNISFPIDNDSVNIIFVDRVKEESKLELVQIDHRGQLVEPSEAFQNFFERDYDDAMNLTHTMAKIKNLEQKSNDRDN